MRVMIMRMMPSPTSSPIPGIIPTVPTPAPAVIRIAPPAVGVKTPVPPQAIGERRERIRIESVVIHIPIPRVQSINYIEIQGTADRNGVTRITETDDTRSIFVVICRAFELSAYPLTVQPVVWLFIDVKSIILCREIVVRCLIPAIIFIYIARISLGIAHHHSCLSVRSMHRHRSIGFYHDFIGRGYYHGLILRPIFLLLSLFFLGRHVVKVVYHTLSRQCPRQTQGYQR